MIRFSNLLSSFRTALTQQNKATYISGGQDYRQAPNSSMGSFIYTPRSQSKDSLSEEEIEKEARSIFQWAKSKGAERYSFICYPHTDGIFEKQDSFLNIQYAFDKRGFKETLSYEFQGNILIKGEGDGSSVPSGGLRQTHIARAYMLWDSHSNLYVRKRNNTLYIPSLLVAHNGDALDMKTLYRMSEKALEKAALPLLEKLGVEATGTKMFLGLEQEYFVVPTEAFEKREDLKWLGRAVVGTNPARNQQLSQHYYARMPSIIEKTLEEIEEELLQIGIPFKTRHNEVAVNQFEIACIFGETGITIDQNMLMMQIMREAYARNGYTALFHEKPFNHINGSGKHANYNFAYIKKDGTIKNVFKQSDSDTELDTKIYKLFMLIQIMAVLKYEKLYMAAIATPGNEVRLGGHEAPPRIFSVFLGDAVSNMFEGKAPPTINNLRDKVNTLNFDVYQENSDRNRTSPFAYTGRVFEFRALGSTQNAAFPMAVIAATMAGEVAEVSKLLDNGKSVDDIIKSYIEQTKKIRFNGNGYSQEWRDEAKKRGLYVNEKFSQLYTFLETEQQIFTKIGVSSPEENASRVEVAKSNYMGIVQIEADTLIYIARRHVLPHAFAYLKSITGDLQSSGLDSYHKDVKGRLEKAATEIANLDKAKAGYAESLSGCQKMREEVHRIGDVVTNLIEVLPPNPNFPDQSEFLNL